MIGFYDYTVVLTYLSLLSAVGGMALAITDHPILATICLLFCGLCDIVAFGVLPAVILLKLCAGCWYAWVIAPLYVLAGLIRLAYFNVTEEQRQKETDACRKTYSGLPITSSALIFPLFYCIMTGYCQKVHGRIGPYKDMFEGSWRGVALCVLAAVTGLCFILPFRIRKPQSKELLLILIIGILIAAALLLAIIL